MTATDVMRPSAYPIDVAVAEIFGPTVQGEGPSTGRRCAFVRLSGCNLTCSWCDTPYTWDWTGLNGTAYDRRAEQILMQPAEILDAIARMDVNRVVVTGGEPLMQRDGLTHLVTALMNAGYRVEIETNGTLTPPAELHTLGVQWNVSPKLAHSGVRDKKRIKARALGWFAAQPSAAFKFVAATIDDLNEIQTIADTYLLPARNIWIMPEGTTPEAILNGISNLADPVIGKGWNLTPRLHVLAWGNKRGV